MILADLDKESISRGERATLLANIAPEPTNQVTNTLMEHYKRYKDMDSGDLFKNSDFRSN